MNLPITLGVDEVGVLPQVGTVAEVLESPVSCFCELLPHQHAPVSHLFPDASSHTAGEVTAPAWWSESNAHIRELHLFKVRDAYVFPAWGVVIDAGGRAMRLPMEEVTYASPDLSALPGIAWQDGRPVLAVPNPIERLASAAVVMPWGAMANYGHFVIDCLPSAAILDEVGALARRPALCPPLKPWQARHFDLLGIEVEVAAQDIVHVDEVVYTSGMHNFLHNPNVNLRAVPERQRPRVTPAAPASSHRLYLSRGRDNRRPMASERRLVQMLEKAGFEAIDTGRMSVDDQIARFAAAAIVVGATGAAFANALYCRPGTRIVEIQPAGMENHWVQGLCFIAGLHHAAYFCPARPSDPRYPERSLKVDLDVDRFIDFVFGRPPLDREPRPFQAPSRLERLRRWLPR